MKKRLRVIVSGRVQGVFFRAHTEEKARALGLSGWVRNSADGRVETIAAGEPALLQTFLEWCHHGPPAAKVTHIESRWETATGEFQSFQITPTV